ncbi:hypothetical protein [Vibrio sp. McD22-P3]|uniref:hypothetical protein n=1 Tax=Vibrio sp. McD22-P3 TaxID=2724880 RepID=UPI001F2255F2|nr:hypothetical protein [Vibrio sp. McD22-P3]MCF4174332.1 hypothetical protein [Vibrio sp. McD22-P3]
MATRFSSIEQPKKENRGRKKLPPEDKKTEVVRFKTTLSEYEILDYLRENTGYNSIGSMLYDMFIELFNDKGIVINMPGESAERTQQDLRKIGTNLNQATAAVNEIARWQRNEIRTEKGLEKLQKDLKLLKAVVKKLHEETKTGLHRESFNKETFAKIKVMKKADEIPEISKRLKEKLI